MGLGTKNRLQQTAAACTDYLREQHRDKLGLVMEFISEIEGPGADTTQWNQFTDVRRSRSEMLERVETAFQKWLAGG